MKSDIDHFRAQVRRYLSDNYDPKEHGDIHEVIVAFDGDKAAMLTMAENLVYLEGVDLRGSTYGPAIGSIEPVLAAELFVRGLESLVRLQLGAYDRNYASLQPLVRRLRRLAEGMERWHKAAEDGAGHGPDEFYVPDWRKGAMIDRVMTFGPDDLAGETSSWKPTRWFHLGLDE